MKPLNLTIEKNVPLPLAKRRGGIYDVFKSMEIGDSIFVPDKSPKKFGSVMHYYKRITGFKYALRSVVGGLRIWRVAENS